MTKSLTYLTLRSLNYLYFLKKINTISLLSLLGLFSVWIPSQAYSNQSLLTHEDTNIRVEPILYLHFDYGNQVTNLTPHSGDDDSLIFEDYKQGFLINRYGRLGAGLGPRVQKMIAGNGRSFIGLTPIAEVEVQSTRYVDSLYEAMNLRSSLEDLRRIPDVDDFLHLWKEGESYSYQSRGGIMFLAGIGIGPIGLNFSFINESSSLLNTFNQADDEEIPTLEITGSWKVTLRRYSDTHAHLKITSSDVNSANIHLGSDIMSLSHTESSIKNQTFSYTYDLRLPEGRDLFTKAMYGDIISTQNYIRKSPQETPQALAAQQISTSQGFEYGSLTSFYIGIPFIISSTWSSGEIYNFSRRNTTLNNSEVETHYSIYLRDRQTHEQTSKRGRTELFYGAAYFDTKNQKLEYLAQYKWSWSDEQSNHWRINMAMKELVQITGLTSLKLNITAPDHLSNKLDYSAVNFNFTISPQKIEHLIQKAQTTDQNDWVRFAKEQIESYFIARDTSADPWSICPYDNPSTSSESGPFSLAETSPLPNSPAFKNIENCKQTQIRRTEQSLGLIQAKLLEIDDLINNARNHTNTSETAKALSKALADLGPHITSTPFVFHSLLSHIGTGLRMNYEVKGTHISYYALELETTEAPNQAVATFKSPPLMTSDYEGTYSGSVVSTSRPYIINLTRPAPFVP